LNTSSTGVPDQAVLVSLGKQFRQLLEGIDPTQNRQRTVDAILSEITVDHKEIKLVIKWLLESGQFDKLYPSESPVGKIMRLNSLMSKLSLVFSPVIVKNSSAFLAGYLGLRDREFLIASGPSLSQDDDDEDDDDELCLTSAEAVELWPRLPSMPLVGEELIDRIKQIGDVEKWELVPLCGYYYNDAGRIRPIYTTFYQALVIAKFKLENPGSRILDHPVEVVDGGRFIRVPTMVASKYGLEEGFYHLTHGVNPPGGFALIPLEADESDIFRSLWTTKDLEKTISG